MVAASDVRTKRSYEIFKSVAHLSEIDATFRRQMRAARRPSAARRLGHLQPMLVGAGLRSARRGPCARWKRAIDVGGDRLIGMADMRRAVGVADRGGDVEGVAHGRRPSGGGLGASRKRGDRGEDSAKLEHRRRGIERQPGRDGDQLSRAWA